MDASGHSNCGLDCELDTPTHPLRRKRIRLRMRRPKPSDLQPSPLGSSVASEETAAWALVQKERVVVTGGC